MRGGPKQTPEAYERALEQWKNLPGSVVRPPTDIKRPPPEEPSEPTDKTSQPDDDNDEASETDKDDKSDEEDKRMSLNGTIWAPIGPSPISQGPPPFNGLVSAIAVNPSNSNQIYIGTIGGGVWRTDDGGTSWIPLFDRQLSLGIGEPGALALDPNNTDVVYVGTSSRFVVHPNAGIFKSIDGGASWIQLGSGYPSGNTGNATQFINQTINVIIVDPANSNIVYVASSIGCFVSTDGGLNWTQGVNSNGDARFSYSIHRHRSALASCMLEFRGWASFSRMTADRTGRQRQF